MCWCVAGVKMHVRISTTDIIQGYFDWPLQIDFFLLRPKEMEKNDIFRGKNSPVIIKLWIGWNFVCFKRVLIKRHLCMETSRWPELIIMYNTASASCCSIGPGALFTKRQDVLPPNLVKSRSHKIGCYDDCIALKYDRCLGSAAAEMPVKFESDWKSLNPNLVASRLHEILR